MKLYKFRSIYDEESLRRVMDIIETGHFWCAKFWQMNDPLEGVFEGNIISNNILSKKNDYSICSLSGDIGFKNPAMWGYYANGFKGVAIEIEIDCSKVTKVEYTSKMKSIDDEADFKKKITTILSTKRKAWKHEGEYRFLVKGNNGLYSIGKITKVYIGQPYRYLGNSEEIHKQCPSFEQYDKRIERLREIAVQRNIDCEDVSIVGDEVKGKTS